MDRISSQSSALWKSWLRLELPRANVGYERCRFGTYAQIPQRAAPLHTFASRAGLKCHEAPPKTLKGWEVGPQRAFMQSES